MVAINGNPTKAGAAFAAVYAAALANGGSFDNIQPGVDFFNKLKKAGNFVPVTGSSPATVAERSDPDPDLVGLPARPARWPAKLPTWKVVIPSDGDYAALLLAGDQQATAPHPAAARLWEEYLYSAEGQNLWLKGSARPILLPTMVKDGTRRQGGDAKLPPAPSGDPTFPTDAQQTAAKAIVVPAVGRGDVGLS